VRAALRTLAALFALLGAAFAETPAPKAPPLVRAVESVGYSVSDLDRAVRFFTEVLEVSDHRQSRWLDYVNRPRRLSQLAAHERLG